MTLPQLPPASVPPLDDRGGDTSLPPLLSRVWWLFFNAVAQQFGVVADSLSTLSNTVFGRGNLTHPGAIPKVSAAGTLDESAVTDDGTSVTITRTIAGTVQPMLLFDSGATAKSRIGRVVSAPRLDLGVNLAYDGTNWNLDDVALPGSLQLFANGQIYLFAATAGANPRTPLGTFAVDVAGNVDALASYKVNGTKVVGARGAAVTAPTGGATVDAQARTAINDILARLGSGAGHGLIT